MGYLPGMWHDFGIATGGLAGALTGLLFVAVSIKSDALAKSLNLRSRAAQTLVLFMTSALAAVLLVAPQPAGAIGGELIALAAVSGAALFILDRRGGHDAASRVARYIEVASPNALTSVLFCIAGLTLLLSAGGGLYWLIPAVVLSLAGGVINAWLFLVRVLPIRADNRAATCFRRCRRGRTVRRAGARRDRRRPGTRGRRAHARGVDHGNERAGLA